MKNKLIYTLSALLFLFVSCEDDLYLEPITKKVSTNFYKTEAEIEQAVNAVYASLQKRGLYELYLPAIGEIPSDNTFDEVPANDGGIYGQLDEFTIVTHNALIKEVWKESYIGIQRCNIVLNRIEDVDFEKEKVKTARRGEVRFIRALLYFNLVRLFGDVPLVVKETEDPNDYFGQGRTPTKEVYKQIVTDLQEAIIDLPLNPDKMGKATKTAAQTLLGKVYLTQKDYTNSKSQLLAVYESGKHQLLSSLTDVFKLDNENNAEIIFAIQFASGVNGNSEGSMAYQQFSPSGLISGAKGHNIPTRELYQLFADQDLRKIAYIGITEDQIPFGRKFDRPSGQPEDGGSDFVVLRFADLILMLAEAENELNNTLKAAEYLNLIRNRAGLEKSATSKKEELRSLIEKERRLELLNEGHRWFDLLRTGRAVEIMNKWFESQGKNTRINEQNLLMPIPKSQIDTDPSIVQNPGY
jgi:hypothetical protein